MIKPNEQNFLPSAPLHSGTAIARLRLSSDSQNEFSEVPIVSASPLGICLQLDQDSRYKFGEDVDVQIVASGRRSEFHGTIVYSTFDEIGKNNAFIRFLLSNESHSKNFSTELRETPRWLCSEDHLPRAIAPSPGRFNQFIGFTVKDISKNGLLLVTDLSASYLVPGMRLNLSMHLPLESEVIAYVEVVRLQIGTNGADEVLEVGTKLIDPSDALLNMFGLYLSQFIKLTDRSRLIEVGFVSNNLELGYEFFPLKTKQDYLAALNLRALSESPSNAYDLDARIVLGAEEGINVVTARIRYPGSSGRFNYQDSGANLDRPDSLIEVTEVHIAESVRSDDLVLLALLRYVCTNMLNPTRFRMVVTISNRYAKTLRSCGFEPIAQLGNDWTYLADPSSSMHADTANYLYWNFLWNRITKSLIQSGELSLNGLDKVLFRALNSLEPLSIWYFQLKKFVSKIQILGNK